jgi:hypothetical protein
VNQRPNPPRRTSRRLTVNQVVVLAAVERLGSPTVPELGQELELMRPSEIVRVLDALERREKVVGSGCRTWIYLGDPAGIPHAPQIPAEHIVRYRAISESPGKKVRGIE